jgi:hypothetical protein
MLKTIEQLKQANVSNVGTYETWVSVEVLLYMKEMRYDYKLMGANLDHHNKQWYVRIYE